MTHTQNKTPPNVAVSRGYDACYKAYDGLYQLIKSMRLDWNTIWVSIDHMDLCQTHCKQVPDFSRPPGSDHWPSGQYGLCFGYCFSGQLPLCSHNGEVISIIYKVPRVCQHLGCVFHQKRNRKGVFFSSKCNRKGVFLSRRCITRRQFSNIFGAMRHFSVILSIKG